MQTLHQGNYKRIGERAVMGKRFSQWYSDLELYMARKGADQYPYIPIDPIEWCEKEVWKVHFDSRISIYDAYLREC